MTIHGSGYINLEHLRNEFGPAGNGYIHIGMYYRGAGLVPNIPANYAIPTSGTIYLHNFYGASNTNPGGIPYYAPGSYTFVVPAYANTLSVQVRGAGAASATYSGGFTTNAGGQSSFGNIVAYGGGGAYTGTDAGQHPPAGELPINGAAGGGAVGSVTVGGGAAGGPNPYGTLWGMGGAGGLTTQTYVPGNLPPGSTVAIVVGAGGAAFPVYQTTSTAGSDGSVLISWS